MTTAKKNQARFSVGDRVSLNHRDYVVVGVDHHPTTVAYWLDDDPKGIGILYAREDQVHRA